MSKINRNIAATGVVAALYVAITLIFAPISYGVVQLRLSEMFNHLAAFNKRYIFAVTLGVFDCKHFQPVGSGGHDFWYSRDANRNYANLLYGTKHRCQTT